MRQVRSRSFPLDEELELLPGELSATLAEGVARLGTKLPFEQAIAEVSFFWASSWRKRLFDDTPKRLAPLAESRRDALADERPR